MKPCVVRMKPTSGYRSKRVRMEGWRQAGINANQIGVRKPDRNHCNHARNSPLGQKDAHAATEDRENQALRQKLESDAKESCTNSRAHRHLAAARAGAGQLQVTDVGARD